MTAKRIALVLMAGLCVGTASLLAQAAPPDGADLYAKNCRSCHGVRGTPPRALAKQMSIPTLDAAFLAGRSRDSVSAVIKRGGKTMKGFDGKLSAAEMAAVAGYVRETFGAAAAKPAP